MTVERRQKDTHAPAQAHGLGRSLARLVHPQGG